MQLTINLDTEDWMDFHKYHLLSNKQFLKTKALITYVVPIVFGVFLYYKYDEGTLRMENALLVVFMCAIWVLFYPKRLVSKALNRARLTVDKDEKGIYLGEHQIELSDEQVKHSTGEVKTDYSWSNISEVKETEESLMIFASSALPILIPKNKIDSMVLIELKDILSSKVN